MPAIETANESASRNLPDWRETRCGAGIRLSDAGASDSVESAALANAPNAKPTTSITGFFLTLHQRLGDFHHNCTPV